MTWRIHLSGDQFDLNDLSLTFKENEIKIIRDNHGMFYIESSLFDHIENSDETFTKANDLVSTLNGCLMLAVETRKPIQVAHISKLQEDGSRCIFQKVADQIHLYDRFSISTCKEDGTEETYRQTDIMKKWMVLAQQSDAVKNAFQYLDHAGYKPENLYKVYEIIKGDDETLPRKCSSRQMEKRFTHTLNSPTAMGKEARHGHELTNPPPKPMSYQEARSYLKLVFFAWLNDKK